MEDKILLEIQKLENKIDILTGYVLFQNVHILLQVKDNRVCPLVKGMNIEEVERYLNKRINDIHKQQNIKYIQTDKYKFVDKDKPSNYFEIITM